MLTPNLISFIRSSFLLVQALVDGFKLFQSDYKECMYRPSPFYAAILITEV